MNRADYLLGCAVLCGGLLAGDAADAIESSERTSTLLLPSEIPGVSDEAWTLFADAARKRRREDGALESRPLCAVSEGNGLGMFEIPQRRLADLDLVGTPSATRDPSTGRMVWVADFVAPYSARWFLTDPWLQYRIFSDSMRLYASTVDVPDAGMTLSGQLAIQHKLGPSGLRTWARGARFERTQDFFQRANGIF